MAELKIGVAGAAGRMGQTVIREVTRTVGCVVVAACEHPDHPDRGRDAGELAGIGTNGVEIGIDPRAVFEASDAVIEFSLPDASVAHANLAADTGTAHIIGTTGMTAEQEAQLFGAAQSTRIVWAPNMSIGVNLLLALTEQVACTLGTDFDIEIVEMHHRHKVDAPSGTALALGRAAAAGRDVNLDEVRDSGRDGITGARKAGNIGFAVLRGGDVVGDHTAVFAGPAERIELTHKAASRHIFAAGAVRAALWTKDQPNGLYGMKDVLGLDN